MITVAIIGAGPLGRRLALGAARAGYRVLLEDVMPSNLHHARESIRQELSPEALPAVAFVASIEDAVRDADLVIDCVPDELESKLEILWLLDRMAPPRTVIATPTTSPVHRRPGKLHQSRARSASPSPPRRNRLPPRLRRTWLDRPAELILRAAPFTSDETVALVVDFFANSASARASNSLGLGFPPVARRIAVVSS